MRLGITNMQKTTIHMMRAWCCLQAGEALCDAVSSLPVPVVLEHVVWPLLLSLSRGPDTALALVSIGRTLGGPLAARHLVPPLLAVLASSGTVRQSWTGKSRVTTCATVCFCRRPSLW